MASYLWLAYALIASVMWGFGYAVSEKIINGSSMPITFFVLIQSIFAIVIYAGVCVYLGTYKTGIDVLSGSAKYTILTILVSVAMALGLYAILLAFSLKSATIVNLIEISYPLFTLFFAWILFKDVQLNWTQAFGGLLIFLGAALIIWKG